jgi:hypothetical protein
MTIDNNRTVAGHPAGAAALAATVYLTGANHFDGQQFQQGLAQVFCIAIREAILDELEGIAPNLPKNVADAVNMLHPSTPQGIKETFSEVEAVHFVSSYNEIRLLVAQEGVDLKQFADALRDATIICKTMASRS